MDEGLTPALDQGWWTPTCSLIQGHAHDMGRLCPGEPARLMAEAGRRFCNQPMPATEEVKALRQQQFFVTLSIIASLATGDSLARRCPASVPAILTELRKLCDQDLPMTAQECSAVTLHSVTLAARLGGHLR